MTNVQTVIVAASIIIAGLIASQNLRAESSGAGNVSAVPHTTSPFAWFVVRDEIWFCEQAKCKKTGP